jgi:acetyl-CoA synthetase
MSIEEFRSARDLLLALGEDYAAARARFAWPKLDRFNWALDWFDGELAKGESGARAALTILGDTTETHSFAELSHASSRLANGLRALGAKRGDRLLLMLGNVAPLWIATLAAMKLGLVVIPATPQLGGADIDDRFARGRARFVIADRAEVDKFAGRGENAVRIAVGGATSGWLDYASLLKHGASFAPDGPTHADDALLLYFTSGTTARPKLVLHSHASYPVGHLSTMFGLGLRPGDVHLNISSPGWAKHAWSSFFAPWNAGATILTLGRRFDARSVLDDLVTHQATSFCAPPTVWRMLIQLDLAQWKVALREINAAGEPLNPEIIEQVRRAWGLTLRDSYGQTETTMMVGNAPGQTIVAGSMGRPLPGYQVVLLDAEGHESDQGEIALPLAARPFGLTRGYQNEAGETVAFTGDYYRTGDVAARDAEGYITYIGRSDDVFKSNDYRLSPFELESALIEHTAIAEAAVVPAPDPMRMTTPKAYVVLAEGHAPDRATALSIFTFLRERLAPFKRVRRLEFADLPKTISGKIRRVELRQREAELAKAGARAEGEFRIEEFPELK